MSRMSSNPTTLYILGISGGLKDIPKGAGCRWVILLYIYSITFSIFLKISGRYCTLSESYCTPSDCKKDPLGNSKFFCLFFKDNSCSRNIHVLQGALLTYLKRIPWTTTTQIRTTIVDHSRKQLLSHPGFNALHEIDKVNSQATMPSMQDCGCKYETTCRYTLFKMK